MFTIYSKTGCPNCEKAKMALYLKGKSFDIKMLDKDFTIQEFMDNFKSRSFPVVTSPNGDIYKTYEELEKGLN